MSSLRPPRPLFIAQDVAACLQPTEKKKCGRPDEVPTWHIRARTDRHFLRNLLGLNGWYTGLETRLFHVSRERLKLTSYAVLLTRSSDSSSCLPGLSIGVRPSYNVLQPAEEAVAAPARLPVALHVVLPRVQTLQSFKNEQQTTAVASADARPSSGIQLGMFSAR